MKKLLGILAGLLLAASAQAQVFNLFGPSTGILKGSTTTYQTTAAVGTDIPAAGATTQVQYNNSGVMGASSNLTWNAGSAILNLGASLTPGSYSVGVPDSMTISGTAMSVPVFMANSNIQGNLELHSYTSATPAAGAFIYGARSRGSITTPSAVTNGDNLLTLGGAGYDGTNYTWGAHIHLQVDGTPSAGVMPGAIDFQTTPTGSNTPASRLFIGNQGNVTVKAAASGVGLTVSSLSGSNAFQVSSTTGAAGALSAGWSVGVVSNAWNLYAQGTDPLSIGTSGSGLLSLVTNGVQRLSVNSGGNFIIGAPGSGVAETINGVSGTHSTKIADSATNLFNAGFLEVPINTAGATYTAVLSDSGKTLYYNGTGATTYTIPANGSVAYPVGTTLTFINDATGATNMTIAITTDTLVLSPGGTTGSRTLAQFGKAVAIKVTSTRWIISGSGLT
jgi:hypothetical protein